MNFIQTIFVNIGNKLGLELAEKKVYGLDYFNIDNISITATLASRIATITLIDSDVNVAGDNLRANAINDIIEELENTQLKPAIEVALGTGDCLLKPYTDGSSIGYSLIPSPNFYITDSIGNKIKACLVKADEFEKNNITYERIEYHYLTEENGVPVLNIDQMAFKNGIEIPISSVERWADLENIKIPNVDRMLFGRIKSPVVNRGDINSANGVPITYGMDKVVDNSVEAYDRFNKEMSDKETLIFIGKQLSNDKKENNLPKSKRNLFQVVKTGSIDTDEYIKEYSPEIRDSALTEGIQQNFKMLELLAGLSSGVLTPPTTNFATATEMKANLQMTFAFMQALRKSIENSITDLAYATNVIMNLNNMTPIGDYELIFNWSDSYIENMETQLTALLQSQAIGGTSVAEVRSFVHHEPLDIATEKVEEMESTNINLGIE